MAQVEIYKEKKKKKLELKNEILAIKERFNLNFPSIATAMGKNTQYVRNRMQSDSIDKYYYFEDEDLKKLKKFYNIKN